MMSGNVRNGKSAEILQLERDLIADSFAILLTDVIDGSIDTSGAVIIIDHTGNPIIHHELGISNWSEGLRHKDWSSREEVGSNALSQCLSSQSIEYTSHTEHTMPDLQHMNCLAAPAFNHGIDHIDPIVVGLLVPADFNRQTAIYILKSMVYALQYEMKLQIEKLSARERRMRHIVFETVNLFHAKIDVDSVLTDAMQSLERMFPDVQIDLFLSQDNQSAKLTVKPLLLDSDEHHLCAQSFMAGTVKIGENEQGGVLVAAPLSGKQGVYGVFQLSFQRGVYQETDLEFITLLVDSAGSAFENAKLYEQSNLLIGELRLINEITRRLNQSLKLQDIFTFASQELIKIFDANYGCVLKLDSANDRFIVEASNLPTFTNEIISIDYGFSGVVYKTKEPLIISDYSLHSNVESKLMVETDSRSLIATPILVNSSVVGAIFVTHREPNYFTYENYKLLQVISVHIGLAIANASLHAEVRRMVITDNLTGLFVRSYLDEQIAMMQKKDYCGALILVDVDDFKQVNDTYGHQIGDKVLIQVGEIIKANIRDSDIAARWGGEELAIYLPLSKLEHTKKVAERIRTSIYNQTAPRVSVSCGISLWSWEDETISVESLFYRADMALYKAKNEGRNKIVIG